MPLLDATTLSRLAGVRLRARTVMEGVLSGLHKSPHQGQSVEFAEHKEYAPGDELRHLDWKAYGKVDKFYVKRFEHETNLRAFLVLDGSGSMGYRSGALTKLEVGAILAGALAYLLVRQQDAAGLTLVSGGKFFDLPPRAAAGQLTVLLERLEQAKAEGETDLLATADHLAEKAPRRSQITFFSDLMDERPEAIARLVQLRARGNDVSIFHLLDPAELTFPFDDPTLFLSMEDERRIEINPREIKESYLEEITAFCERAKSTCQGADVDYERVRTDERLDEVLLRWLSRRQRRR